MPAKRADGATALRCSRCGYEVLTGKTVYTIGSETSSTARVRTTSVISEGRAMSRKKEEIEYEKEEYYKELFMELLSEEEYGGEEA